MEIILRFSSIDQIEITFRFIQLEFYEISEIVIFFSFWRFYIEIARTIS